MSNKAGEKGEGGDWHQGRKKDGELTRADFSPQETRATEPFKLRRGMIRPDFWKIPQQQYRELTAGERGYKNFIKLS